MSKRKYSLDVGIATVDITPPVGVTLVGYRPRVSTALAHPLRAEALVCTGDGGTWALITSDVIGYPARYTAQVRERVRAETGLPGEAVLLCGTHTHSAPATIQFGGEKIAEADSQYLSHLEGRLAAVVAEALRKARPGRFEVAWTEAPALGSNRRVQLADGKWGNEWEDPEGKHPGHYDPAVMLVGVRRPRGKLDALVVNYGCHPVVLGPSSLDISADYVGYMKDALEASGVASTVIFALAGGANINPRVCIKVGAEYPRAMGERLGQIVAGAVPRLSSLPGGRVASHREPWKILRGRDAYKGADMPGSKTGDTIATEIMALRAGELGIVSLPGELFSEFNRMLRQASPLPQTVVVSLANDYAGYLPTDEAQAEGAYETRMAPAEGLESALMEHAVKALSAVAK
jgi:hypothetical protein